MRIRTFIEHNYRGIFHRGKTIRQKVDKDKSFSALPYAELEDIGINTRCLANCSYCYTSAIKNGKDFDNIVDKALDVYGNMSLNERPFQVAIGGSGEATIHKDFVEFVKTVKSLDILPNYTTNGMHLTEQILTATQDHCGGVAVSYHPHIQKTFFGAVEKLSALDTMLNVHFIVGEPGSTKKFVDLYEKIVDKVDYFVILPYQVAGRAKEVETAKEWDELFDFLQKNELEKLAFGALFYDYMQNKKEKVQNLDLDIYEPEIFSGYRLFDDSYKTLRKSSYDLRPKIT